MTSTFGFAASIATGSYNKWQKTARISTYVTVEIVMGATELVHWVSYLCRVVLANWNVLAKGFSHVMMYVDNVESRIMNARIRAFLAKRSIMGYRMFPFSVGPSKEWRAAVLCSEVEQRRNKPR